MIKISEDFCELKVLEIHYREKDGKNITVAMCKRKPVEVDLWEDIKKQMDAILEQVL